MGKIEIDRQKNIEEIIKKLRLKLNITYETKGHTKEVIRLSQELDKYISLAQKELLSLENNEENHINESKK